CRVIVVRDAPDRVGRIDGHRELSKNLQRPRICRSWPPCRGAPSLTGDVLTPNVHYPVTTTALAEIRRPFYADGVSLPPRTGPKSKLFTGLHLIANFPTSQITCQRPLELQTVFKRLFARENFRVTVRSNLARPSLGIIRLLLHNNS